MYWKHSNRLRIDKGVENHALQTRGSRENTYSGLSLLNSGTKSVAGLRRIFGNLGNDVTNGKIRPPRISKYGDATISEQIIFWMEYIEANPNERLYHDDLIAPDIFSNAYAKYKGFIEATSDRENSFGGSEYTIINPKSTSPNNRISDVGLIRKVNRLSIRLYPNYDKGNGADAIVIYIYDNKQYNEVLNRIFN